MNWHAFFFFFFNFEPRIRYLNVSTGICSKHSFVNSEKAFKRNQLGYRLVDLRRNSKLEVFYFLNFLVVLQTNGLN